MPVIICLQGPLRADSLKHTPIQRVNIPSAKLIGGKPWDFWRFSGDAWHALFNEKTGFRVVDKVLAYEMVPISFYY
jgi:hypothetical protein